MPPEAELGLDEDDVPPEDDEDGLLLCDVDGELLDPLDESFDEPAA